MMPNLLQRLFGLAPAAPDPESREMANELDRQRARARDERRRAERAVRRWGEADDEVERLREALSRDGPARAIREAQRRLQQEGR